MRIKRFEAPDTKTALAMVKKEMGEDAVILSSKRLSSCSLAGRKGWLEVVAAMDFDPEKIASYKPRHNDANQKVFSDTAGPSMDNHEKTFWIEPRSGRPADAASFLSDTGADAVSSGDQSLPDLSAEATNLRKRFAGFFSNKLSKSPELSGNGSPQKNNTTQGKTNPQEIARWRDQLIEQIKVKPLAVDSQTTGPAVFALVGATGVGKTTTAAKIAAWFTLRENKKVSLLTNDCYRIGATDQLRTYAKIMQIPCDVVLRKDDLTRVIARYSNRDMIIIDTAGKSPYDDTHVDNLMNCFGTCDFIRPVLVLSATTKKEDLAATITAYRRMPLAGLVLTKLDETRAYAYLCQQVVASSLPVTSLCTGQRVPEDFFIASKNFLSTLFKDGWPAFEGRNPSSAMALNC